MKKYFIILFYLFEKHLLKIKLGFSSVVKYPFVIWNKECLEISKNVFISEGSFFAISPQGNEAKVKIGDNTTIGKNFFVAAVKKVEIGKDVLISNNVFITDHNHSFNQFDKPIIQQGLEYKGSVIIGDGSFIGINSVILPGVKIGKNACIGASSVVTKDVPDYAVLVGNPGKIIKHYDKKEKKWVSKNNKN